MIDHETLVPPAPESSKRGMLAVLRFIQRNINKRPTEKDLAELRKYLVEECGYKEQST